MLRCPVGRAGSASSSGALSGASSSLLTRSSRGNQFKYFNLRQASVSRSVSVRAEKKEYYDYKDMPPLPMTIARIHIPELGYTIVDKASEPSRMASMAIFYDLSQDAQYQSKLNRKSAITALCMFDREDVDAAQRVPGDFPNIDLLYRVYNQGLELDFVVEERGAAAK